MQAPMPIVLADAHVRLVPLVADDVQEVFAAGRDPRIWELQNRGPFVDEADARAYVKAALAEVAAGRQLPFVVRDARDGAWLGMTRYMDLQLDHGGLEIGHTWLVPAAWCTAVNSAAKRLLLGHAFERLGAARVCLKTDVRNHRSRRAIERLGAQHEGIARHHMRRADGSMRDSVYYSILADEWPAVRARLEVAAMPAILAPAGS